VEPVRSEPLTELLLRWKAGDQECLNRLLPQVEGELRRIAGHYMRMEREGHTLQTTALVHEAYLKLVDHAHLNWQNRAQFLAVAAQPMRHILVDHARGLRRGKRGGGAQVLPLEEGLVFSPAKSAALVALDDALTELAGLDPEGAGGGTAQLRGDGRGGEGAVKNDWRMAKLWLKRELSPKGAHAG